MAAPPLGIPPTRFSILPHPQGVQTGVPFKALRRLLGVRKRRVAGVAVLQQPDGGLGPECLGCCHLRGNDPFNSGLPSPAHALVWLPLSSVSQTPSVHLSTGVCPFPWCLLSRFCLRTQSPRVGWASPHLTHTQAKQGGRGVGHTRPPWSGGLRRGGRPLQLPALF